MEHATVQVEALELILHGGAETLLTHLEKDQTSFSHQTPTPQLRKPEEEFALINVLGKLIEAMHKADPNKPEGIVLRAMAVNYVTPQTAAAFVSGAPIPPQKMSEFQTAQFNEAWNAAAQKYREDPPKRDAIGCVGAAAQGKPMTANEVTNVFNNLTEGMRMTPEEWNQVIQHLVSAVKLMKRDADEWNKRMAGQQNPTVMDLANVVREGVNVNADGAITPRAEMPLLQKPDEVMGLLETYRDFWMALLKAGQEPKLRDEAQRQLAQLLRYVGARYVRTGRSGSMKSATEVDARATRFLIQKLRANPVIKANKAQMAALEKIANADSRGKPMAPNELVEIFDTLGKGVQLTPEILRAVLEVMIKEARTKPKAADLIDVEKLIASGGVFNPADAVRMISKATVQKPAETMACLELFTNFFLAMAATNQNAALRDQYQRMMVETLQGASQLYGTPQQTKLAAAAAPKTAQPIDVNAYRMILMKLRADRGIKADPAKARAVEELVAAQATGKPPSAQQLVEIFNDLGKGIQMTPEMLRIILEFMCKELKALSMNEKVEMQKRLKHSPTFDPAMVVDEATRVRSETTEVQQQAQIVGCFQVFPEGHPAFANRPAVPTRSKEVGMRAGPASVDWHRYQALGIQPPEEEMARVILVQSQLTNAANFEDDQTQKTLMKEAGDVTFRSILQPTVMGRYQESLKTDKTALSALQGLSRVGAMDDKQLEKRVDNLLTTLTLNRAQLKARVAAAGAGQADDEQRSQGPRTPLRCENGRRRREDETERSPVAAAPEETLMQCRATMCSRVRCQTGICRLHVMQ